MRTIHQLQIRSGNEHILGLARAVLLNLGFKEEDLAVISLKGTCGIELFDESAVKLAKVKKFFGKLKFKGVQVRQRRLAPRDWLTRWKSQWKPAPLTKKLDVVPVWYKDKYKPRGGRGYILMDTIMSFGTGLHETTRFMAQFIEDKKGGFRSFLDIGTGTGILGLVALKYGAQDVQAIDIEELSLEAAHGNMKANGLYFHVQKADIKGYRPRKTFDFAAANLITQDLIEHAEKIAGLVKKGGFLAVSGVSLDNLKRLRKKFSSLPLKCLKISKGEQWAGLLYQKKMS